MSFATLKRQAKQAKSKKPATESAKLSPRIEQLWYAQERQHNDGRFWREYRTFPVHDRQELQEALNLPRDLFPYQFGQEVQAGVTLDCQPPTHALLSIDIRAEVFPSVDIHISRYADSAEAAADYHRKPGVERDGYATRISVVIEVDRNGFPTPPELVRVRKMILLETVEEAKRAKKRIKNRERYKRRRDAQKAKGGAA